MKRKPKTLNARERKLQAEWEAIIKKHSKPLERGAISKGVQVGPLKKATVVPTLGIGPREGSDVNQHASLGAPSGSATVAASKVYTGDQIVGIATMHKSNLVPIFSQEDAVSIAKMRRG
jgi:hypothetical protein